jgi:transcriptional regulator with XRE-family HTH domain
MYKKRNLMTAITRLRETAIGLTPPELARQSYHGLSAAATIFFAKNDTKATHRGNPDLRQRGKESREAKNKRLSRGSFFMPQRGERNTMKESYRLYAEILQERGLTSYRVALESKVPESALSRWKRGHSVPKWESMHRIASFLSTPERPVTEQDFYRADAEAAAAAAEGGEQRAE